MRQDLANRILKAATARLGEPVTLSRDTASYSLRGIFSEIHSEVDVDTGILQRAGHVGDLVVCRSSNCRRIASIVERLKAVVGSGVRIRSEMVRPDEDHRCGGLDRHLRPPREQRR